MKADVNAIKNEDNGIIGVLFFIVSTATKVHMIEIINELERRETEPMMSIDMEGYIRTWNKKAITITGYPRVDVINKQSGKLFITQEYSKMIQGLKTED